MLAVSTRRRGVPESVPRFAEEHGGHGHLDTHVSPEDPRHEHIQLQPASLMLSCTPNTSSRDHKHIRWTFNGRYRLGNLKSSCLATFDLASNLAYELIYLPSQSPLDQGLVSDIVAPLQTDHIEALL